MRSLVSRLEALELRTLSAVGPWLSITYDEGEAPASIAALEAAALAEYVAERGEARGEASFIHRVIVSPRPPQAVDCYQREGAS